jgi:polyvinyl alcohol dehydrogenase (cytochrome)
LTLLSAGTAEAASSSWPSYGGDFANSRSQDDARGIGIESAQRLRARWALRAERLVDGATPSVTSTPAVVGGTAYYADWQGDLSAVKLSNGEVRWSTDVTTEPGPLAAINSSPVVSGDSVYVGTADARVVAVARQDGAIRWSTRVDDKLATILYGSPVVIGHILVTGVASSQNFLNGPYDFRGSVVALDTRDGRLLWRRWIMRPGIDGTGGSVWSTAAVDRRRGVAYIGTGQAYTEPVSPLNDALLALRLRDGAVVWKRVFTADDVWTLFGPPKGKDYDIGAAPNLFRIGKRAVVGVGDKSGRYATLARESGRTIWRRRLCPGSHFGGVMTTAAVARSSIWITCNDLPPEALDLQNPNLSHTYFDNPLIAEDSSRTLVYRLRASSGRTLWRRDLPGGMIGAVSEAGGAVFVPNLDGRLRALNGVTGRTLWMARPGAPLAGGPTVAGGVVLTGYGVQFGGVERFFNPPADARGGLVAYGLRR